MSDFVRWTRSDPRYETAYPVTCRVCDRPIEPCRSVHGGGFMHSDDRRERGDDGHLAALTFHVDGRRVDGGSS